MRLESCRRTIASSTKLGAWRRTGVRAQRTGRRTHRVHPAMSLVLNRCRAARAGMSIRNRENLRHTARRAISAEHGRMSSASRGRRRKAPSSRPARPRRCLPARPHILRPSDARSAAAAPRAPPYDRGKARRSRTGALVGARSHAAAAALARPYRSALPPCAYVPSGRHAQPSAEQADGSQLAPPPPPTRGAAAPSSLVLAVISPVIPAARGT